MGPAAIEWLRPALLNDDPLLRRRARTLVDEIGRETADAEFTVFILNHGEDFDLETGVFLLARTQFPQLSLVGYRALLDSFADDLRPEVNAADTPLARLEVINQYLFGPCGFRGNESKYYDPNNSYLNKVIDLRTGNPISLSTVYMLVARRLGLPMVGVGLPLHFMCRYQNAAGEFYVDPFNRGRIWSRIEVIRRYRNHMLGSVNDHLAPATPRSMLTRMCRNLAQIYQENEMPEAGRFRQYVAALQ